MFQYRFSNGESLEHGHRNADRGPEGVNVLRVSLSVRRQKKHPCVVLSQKVGKGVLVTCLSDIVLGYVYVHLFHFPKCFIIGMED